MMAKTRTEEAVRLPVNKTGIIIVDQYRGVLDMAGIENALDPARIGIVGRLKRNDPHNTQVDKRRGRSRQDN